jgi:hypothetical protein
LKGLRASKKAAADYNQMVVIESLLVVITTRQVFIGGKGDVVFS